MSRISQLVQYAKIDDHTNSISEINFGNVPNFQAQSIAAQTGVQIRGSVRIISSYAINHILKRHGDDKSEKERGQIGVTDEDFELIPIILNTPDSVVKGKDGSRGKKALIFSKRLAKGNHIVVMSLIVKIDGNRLEVDTMYIKQ